ncbi:MAG: single-stranded DNA-binding protein [Cyanobacteria bacterium NC_groundwater_1444_Ag_S-0.65um_54_12]|nr:single-stranded DNA-binding protein [Cyanobacteria bacterium NC_groundwater_1444_Ag_S-0.65um_54_12]
MKNESSQASAQRLISAAETLRNSAARLQLSGIGPIAYVYNPLDYAWEPHRRYLERFGRGNARRAVFVGMNPGPWGMGQTGVPFGDPVMVREWMGITGQVTAPAHQHPKRPVLGFASRRREPSGTRIYSWARARWGTADAFFGDCFVANYCPLLLFDEAGNNITPAELRSAERSALLMVCDAHLAVILTIFLPAFVIGVGNFAHDRSRAVVKQLNLSTCAGKILHPSPTNPQAQEGWSRIAERQLQELGFVMPDTARPPGR